MLASIMTISRCIISAANPLAGIHRGKPAAARHPRLKSPAAANESYQALSTSWPDPNAGALAGLEMFQRDGKTAEVERLLVYSVRDELLWNAGSTTRIRRSSTRFSPRRRRRVRPRDLKHVAIVASLERDTS